MTWLSVDSPFGLIDIPAFRYFRIASLGRRLPFDSADISFLRLLPHCFGRLVSQFVFWTSLAFPRSAHFRIASLGHK